MNILDDLFSAMTDYYMGDPKRIQHFTKVHAYARQIGLREGLGEKELLTLEAAAYVHDIGIKPSEQKYGVCDGLHQETEGPAPAREMLERLGFDKTVTDRVCCMIAHHHTYKGIDGVDLQILIEADFLVNLYEDSLPVSAVKSALERVFVTPSGKELLKTMYGL